MPNPAQAIANIPAEPPSSQQAGHSNAVAEQLAAELLALYPSSNNADPAVNDAMRALICQLHAQGEAGHTCLSISDFNQQYGNGWLTHPLCVQAGSGALAPIVLHQGYASFARHYVAELSLAQDLKRISHSTFVSAINPAQLNMDTSLKPGQQQAVLCALGNSFSVICGGPGTGKTHTLARIVTALAQLGSCNLGLADHLPVNLNTNTNPNTSATPLAIALAAPTGKAALRMQQALSQALAGANVANLHIAPATTVHRLLGIGFANNRPTYHRANTLPFDVIVIDEASMLDLELASKLCSAVASGSKLIWLGDAAQLAAVGAGCVLADVAKAPALAANHVLLTESTRFGQHSGVGYWANLVLSGNLAALAKPIEFAEVTWQQNWQAAIAHIAEPYKPYAQAIAAHALPAELFASLAQYRILCSTHYGEGGVHALNQLCAQALFGQSAHANLYFNGSLLMLRRNQAKLQLANGDVAICLHGSYLNTCGLRLTGSGLATDHFGDGYYLLFEGGQVYASELFEPGLLQSAFAMTVHKAQGSEFKQVAVVLPALGEALADQPERSVLSRQLLYTAITRSKGGLALYADAATLQYCIGQNAQRITQLSTHINAVFA